MNDIKFNIYCNKNNKSINALKFAVYCLNNGIELDKLNHDEYLLVKERYDRLCQK